MICQHCGCFFCPDDADPFDGSPKLYCSKAHARKARRARKERRTSAERRKLLESCGRKMRYESIADALTALRWLREDGRAPENAHVYECPCAGWHITSREWGEVGPRDLPRDSVEMSTAE